MRVTVVVVSTLMMVTSSEASQSCMSKAEARQHFGSVHIYWHGPDHCWDATPTQRHQIRRSQPKNDQPKWQNSLSQMLQGDEPVQTLRARRPEDVRQHPSNTAADGAAWSDRWVDIEPTQIPILARWVDIDQVIPSPIAERKPERKIQPRGVIWVFIAIVLALAIIEILFRADLVVGGSSRYRRAPAGGRTPLWT